jgi:hypothetical protein
MGTGSGTKETKKHGLGQQQETFNRQELLHKRRRKKWASRSGNISTEATIFYYYKGGRGTTQPATGTTKHWRFF